jgi:hypothetical protein
MERKGSFSREGISRTRTLAFDAPLPQHAPEGSALGDELWLMELQLMRAFRERNKTQAAARPAPDSPTKAKIVRALRKKR